MTSTTAPDFTTPCSHCGAIHSGVCSRIKAIEYYEDGVTVKRVEYHEERATSQPHSPLCPGTIWGEVLRQDHSMRCPAVDDELKCLAKEAVAYQKRLQNQSATEVFAWANNLAKDVAQLND